MMGKLRPQVSVVQLANPHMTRQSYYTTGLDFCSVGSCACANGAAEEESSESAAVRGWNTVCLRYTRARFVSCGVFVQVQRISAEKT